MDKITISDFIVNVRIGYGEEERSQPQRLRINLSIETDFTEVLTTGNLVMGVDYSEIRKSINVLAHSREFTLLEAFAAAILGMIFENPRILGAKVTVQKLDCWKGAAIPGVILERKND